MISKCQCQHCNGEIEFEAAQFERSGETSYRILGQSVDCPHCGNATQLYLKRTDFKAASNTGNPKTSLWTIIIGAILIIALLTIFLWSAISNHNFSESMTEIWNTFLLPAVLVCVIGFLILAVIISKLWWRMFAGALIGLGVLFLLSRNNSVA